MNKLAQDYFKQFENIVVPNEISLSLVQKAQELNADQLNKNDLKEIKDTLSIGISKSKYDNEKSLEDKKISLPNYKNVRDSLLELESAQNQLVIAYIQTQLDSILTDELSGAKAKIIQAIDKLQQANAGLKEIDNFLNFLGKLTNLISAIFVAIQTPSVAAISSILQQLNAIQ